MIPSIKMGDKFGIEESAPVFPTWNGEDILIAGPKFQKKQAFFWGGKWVIPVEVGDHIVSERHRLSGEKKFSAFVTVSRVVEVGKFIKLEVAVTHSFTSIRIEADGSLAFGKTDPGWSWKSEEFKAKVFKDKDTFRELLEASSLAAFGEGKDSGCYYALTVIESSGEEKRGVISVRGGLE